MLQAIDRRERPEAPLLLNGTRWRETLRGALGAVHRELRLSLTPFARPERWVFVVGCYNSGTELLVRLLGSHPQVSALPEEGQFLTDQFPADYELGLPRMWALREDLFRLNELEQGPDVARLKREWLMRLDRSRRVFLEKSPPNAARTRWLQQHFENAHFIAIVRNGYAVAEGIRRKAEPFHLKDGWPIELCARQWNRSYEVLLEDAPYLRKLLWVHYEDLAATPELELARMLEFLQLPPAPLAQGASWEVHEKNEPIRDMNEESLRGLSLADRMTVTREAGPMLRHFGYDVLP